MDSQVDYDPMSRVAHTREVSIDYLRATLTILVVAHHSALAYTGFATFDAKNYLASTAPIVDAIRWPLLDRFVGFNDAFFMSLMFFVSGLFVWPSILKEGAMRFSRRRFLRLGLPFLVCVGTLSPLAYYWSWTVIHPGAPLWRYWLQNITHGWPSGPLWFVWLLLAFDLIIAAIYPLVRNSPETLVSIEKEPVPLALLMIGVCAVAYIPLLLWLGFDGWHALLSPPFWLQAPRSLLYFVWFAAGVWLGRSGQTHLFAPTGKLARKWPAWVVSGLTAYAAFAFCPTFLDRFGVVIEPRRNVVEGALWAICCVVNCFAFAGVFAGLVKSSNHPLLQSLSRSAYCIYLIHYVFVVGMQRLLMLVEIPAPLKFALTFICAISLSWGVSLIVLKSSWARKVL